MTKEQFLSFDPCHWGIDYVNGFASVREAWDNCKTVGDMLWLAGNFPKARDNIILFMEECACIALFHLFDNIDRAPTDAAVHHAEFVARCAISRIRFDVKCGNIAISSIMAARFAIYTAYTAANATHTAAYIVERAFQIKRIRELFTDIIFNDENN